MLAAGEGADNAGHVVELHVVRREGEVHLQALDLEGCGRGREGDLALGATAAGLLLLLLLLVFISVKHNVDVVVAAISPYRLHVRLRFARLLLF